MSQTTHEEEDQGRHANIVKGKCMSLANKGVCRFTDGKGAFEMCHAFHYFFSLVHISEFLKANFLSTNLCAVYASPEKLVEPLCKADTIEKIRYHRF